MSFRIRRRKLPHWNIPGASCFVTACLEGSIPAQGLLRLREYESELLQAEMDEDYADDEWQDRIHKLLFSRFDQILDQESVVMHLEDPALAGLVKSSLYHFSDERYELISYVVMGSHYHWLFRPTKSYEAEIAERDDEKTARELIMHSIASYTANECNRLLRRRSPMTTARETGAK